MAVPALLHLLQTLAETPERTEYQQALFTELSLLFSVLANASQPSADPVLHLNIPRAAIADNHMEKLYAGYTGKAEPHPFGYTEKVSYAGYTDKLHTNYTDKFPSPGKCNTCKQNFPVMTQPPSSRSDW